MKIRNGKRMNEVLRRRNTPKIEEDPWWETEPVVDNGGTALINTQLTEIAAAYARDNLDFRADLISPVMPTVPFLHKEDYR